MYRTRSLTSSCLFHMFTQSIKFYILYCHVLKSAMFGKGGSSNTKKALTQKRLFLRGFILTATETVLGNFNNSSPFERLVCFYIPITWKLSIL